MNGPSHHSIREPQSVARLSRTFSKSLSAVDLAEPLLSLDENQPVALGAELMGKRGITVLGVRRDGLVGGWVGPDDLTTGTLGEHLREFHRADVLDESASLALVLGVFARTDQAFIDWRGEVTGVITRRDLQKPPLRMWLFGAITVLDANMTGAIEQLYPGDAWQSLISPRRAEKAAALQKERDRRKSPCRLIDCLQIGDKATILTSETAHLAAVGFPSKNEAQRLMAAIEDLRNHLAHAQELSRRHLTTATKLAAMIDSILRAEGVQRILASRADAPKIPEPSTTAFSS